MKSYVLNNLRRLLIVNYSENHNLNLRDEQFQKKKMLNLDAATAITRLD